jgi:hypothetical protein
MGMPSGRHSRQGTFGVSAFERSDSLVQQICLGIGIYSLDDNYVYEAYRR